MAYISLQNMYHLSFTLLVSESNPNYLKENGNALNHTTRMLKSFAGFMYSWVENKTKQTPPPKKKPKNQF